ncbi:hypothetical protein [Vibrio anguillarum]|uniref:Uncharacterized protein n=7 Tax=Vibrio anguillarum TaxID=55601 RepID=A0AAW4AZS6_VIBAN|nr:hypothetical protein [Vibrio anguillarum]AOT26294.1 hypothetical protein Her_0018 [Vibrio phage Her]AOT26385.1 hypothetical protein CLA_0018 [Vibrio phage Cla]AOT26567.1 hypothetical protein Pel_0018 [Vibrio phage Pel]AOT26658.1 hypothetical protein pVa2_0017 [Vibrio phage pVa-2]AOT26749.1 hypothetical protein pVa1_0018 [Vibrio phage pVa-1]AOT26840.1 hypothetical protein pVa5_0018 [Vibrio phage vB_VspP_pVa5_12Jun]AOT26931.1 hypothetical protein pVa6_0018 [Vibrio phage pVa-6]AOT27118.1 hy
MNIQQVFSDMEPSESMRDFAIRKSIEAERARSENANLRDWIHDIAVNSGDEQRVMDAISSALSGEPHGKEKPEFLAPIAAELCDSDLARSHVTALVEYQKYRKLKPEQWVRISIVEHCLIIDKFNNAIDFATKELSKIYA